MQAGMLKKAFTSSMPSQVAHYRERVVLGVKN